MKTGLKKLLSLMMALAMVASLGVTASAADITSAGDTGDTPVTLEAAGASFRCALPLSLPVAIDSEGVVTVADDCKIINYSHGQVNVKNVSIASNDWTIVDYAKDMTKVKVGTKEFGFKLQNEVTGADGALSFDAANWTVLDGANDGDTDELVLVYDMNCAAQATAIEAGTQVATVTFEIGFYEAA